MAGGAILSPQLKRANQYTGRFTFFSFITIICGATTGLVRDNPCPKTAVQVAPSSSSLA